MTAAIGMPAELVAPMRDMLMSAALDFAAETAGLVIGHGCLHEAAVEEATEALADIIRANA
jgi:hypothetical protein